jgi:hypothetical protein
MNGPTIAEVDAAVRSVLAVRDGKNGAGGDVFGGSLFGLRHAEALDRGTREVRIVAGTVVTPLARDFLKRAGIVLRVASRAEAPRGGEWGFAIAELSGVAEALRRSLLVEEREAWIEVGTDHRQAARWVAERPARGAVVVTGEASVATWEACRVEGVRAATVGDADSATRAARHLGANLLVVEMAGQSIASLRGLMAAFRRMGVPGSIGGGHEDRRGDRPGDLVAGPPDAAERALGGRAALDLRGADGRGFPTW